MATYIELHNLRGAASTANLRQQIAVALMVKSNVLAKATPNAAQKAFATAALANPEQYANTLIDYILAEYNTAAVGAITGATDAQVQTAVNTAVDTLLGV